MRSAVAIIVLGLTACEAQEPGAGTAPPIGEEQAVADAQAMIADNLERAGPAPDPMAAQGDDE